MDNINKPAAASGDELPAPWWDRIGTKISEKEARGAEREELIAAVSAATKPTADLSNLTRFYASEAGHMLVGSRGDYVRFHDVQSLLATKPAAAQSVPDAVRLAGAKMANTMFNLAQQCGNTVSSDLCSKMDAMRKEWDNALFVALAAAPMASDDAVIEAREQALNEAAELVLGCHKRATPHGIATAIRALKRTKAAGAEGAE